MTKAEHLARAAKCGDEAAQAARTAVQRCVMVMEGWDYHQEHAKRMARLAAYHAFKARPDLKPPDRYAQAMAEARGR